MKRTAGLSLLLLSIAAGVYLICFVKNPALYSECIVSRAQYEEIKERRNEVSALFEHLVFEEERLMFDREDGTYYYSLVEGSRDAYDPMMVIEGKEKDVKIAFLEERITEAGIRENRAISFLVYTDEAYAEYSLKCTTLPVMNIDCGAAVEDVPVPMTMTLYDNRQKAGNRITVSEGAIHVRGNTTKIFPKKGYRFSLTQKSVGEHARSNQVSLLGLRQDDDWLLYAGYNDQEKIRNVFSSNLWEYSCATDNALKVDTGMEYRYVELFMDGRYWGLYALGFPIDEKQFGLDADSGEDGLYKVVNWFPDGEITFTEGGNVAGFRIKGTANERKKNWKPLTDYYEKLSLCRGDNEKLYTGIDMDNAMDIYLFVDLMQGIDHAMGGKNIKNLYLAVRNGEEGQTALYAPWDMDFTWGNDFVNDAALNVTLPYGLPVSSHVMMNSGYLYQLLQNDAEGAWEKLFEKYRHLRKTGWSEEAINAMLDEYEADIYDSGAYLREMERWPEGSYAEATEGLNAFRAYVMKRLGEMDSYYEGLELSR